MHGAMLFAMHGVMLCVFMRIKSTRDTVNYSHWQISDKWQWRRILYQMLH